MEILIALTLPGVVLLLIGYAVVERLVNRVIPSRRSRRSATAAAGFDVMHGALAPGRDIELEQKRVERFLRDDDEAAAPAAFVRGPAAPRRTHQAGRWTDRRPGRDRRLTGQTPALLSVAVFPTLGYVLLRSAVPAGRPARSVAGPGG